MRTIRFVSILILTALSTLLYAGGPFEITGNYTTDTGEKTVQVGGSNFPDLLEDNIKANGAFSVLDGKASTSTLNYAGADNAMRFDINAAGTVAVLEIPILNFKRTFTGANRDELYDEIEKFLKNEGSDVYRRFLEAMNRKSLVAVTDGNPSSTTATMANAVFEDAGFGGQEAVAQAVGIENLNLSLLASMGRINSDNFNGSIYSLPLGFGYQFTDRVSTKVRMPLTYREIEGAQIYEGSFIVNVPIKVFMPIDSESSQAVRDSTEESPLSWTLTPSIGIGGAGSADYAAGSMIYMGGLTSMLGYDFNSFKLTMGNNVNILKSRSINVSGYEVGGEVDQQILKNGLKLSIPFNGKWVAEVYGIHTAFLQSAAVDNYVTVGAQAGMRWYGDAVTGGAGLLLLGVGGDFGNDYKSFKVRLGSGFRF